MRLAWLLVAMVLAAVLATAQYIALDQLLYWKYVWLDTFMHFLGGLTVGVFVIAFLGVRRPLLFLVAMVAIAIGWELFELLINAEREDNFAFDTALDLLMDAVGMTTAYIIARKTIWQSA